MMIPLAHFHKSTSRTLLFHYLKPHWRQLLLLFFLLLTALGLDLINPQLLRLFLDTATNNGTFALLGWIVLGFFAVVVLRQMTAVLETYIASSIQIQTTNQLRTDLLAHCLGLDLAFYHTHLPGELIERVDGDIGTLSNFLSRFVVSLLGNALLLIGVLGLLFSIDWRVGASLSAFALLAVVVLRRLQGVTSPLWEKVRQAVADLFSFLEERFQGTEDIRSAGAVEYMLRGHTLQSRSLFSAMVRAGMSAEMMDRAMNMLFTLGTVIALALGIWLLLIGKISIGTLYLIYSYSGLLRRPLAEFHAQMQDLQQAMASLRRVRAFFETESAIQDGEGAPLPVGALALEFRDVSFSYTPGTPVLKHISFAVQPGTILGVIGRTGSGKTTITKLLERFYDPDQGEVRLGDVDLRQLSIRDLRGRIGMITQDIHLFHASLRDNLTLFDPAITDERIVQVIELLGMGAWFQTLPAGLDTHFAPEQAGLSAGEAQLLAFVRVFLKDPDLVILDEASSRLDPATEQRIQQATRTLLSGRTALIIAHRLKTLEHADTILILEDGTCREYGERAALASNPHSRFTQLLRTGFGDAMEVLQ